LDNTHERPPSTFLLIAVSSLGAILAPLNSTMVAVALPDIRHEFSLSHGAVAWLVSGYLIAMAVAQPIGGRLGDELGRERVFRTGLLAFLALAIGTALAPNFPVLVALRVAQAVAGAILMPNGMAMLRAHAPPGQLGRVNGINGGVISFAAAAGPLLGAAVLALGSWRWIFPMSVPFIVLALVLLPRLSLAPPQSVTRAPFDWAGTALFVALLVAITLQLTSLEDRGGAIEETARWSATGAIALAFVWRQVRTVAPAADWPLFRSASFAGATAYTLLANLTMYTTLLMIPFFVREVLNKSTELAGLLLGAMSVLVAVSAPIGGRLSDAFGRRIAAQAGGLLLLLGASMLAVALDADVSMVYVTGCLAILGLGLGLGSGAASTAAVESVPHQRAGSAAGTSSMMRYIGSIIGAGVLAGVLSSETADVATYRLVAIVVVATAALSVGAATFIHRFEAQIALRRSGVAVPD